MESIGFVFGISGMSFGLLGFIFGINATNQAKTASDRVDHFEQRLREGGLLDSDDSNQ